MSLPTFYQRRFWVLFLLVSILAVGVAFWLMHKTQPVLKLDIRMSRAEAIKAAAEFQAREFPALKTNTSAASFNGDRGLQNYVELEAGGVGVYQTLVSNIDAVTHYWRVRRFSEGQETELTTAFSPKGEFVSFWLKVPEQEPGAALNEAEARLLAESKARQLMGDRFSRYAVYETTQTKQTSGRVDFRFVYQHKTLAVGEAKFRLDIRVAGDRVVGLDTFTFIPQGFDQRFAKLRSLNDHIASIANYFFIGLFGVFGLVGGGIWLHRQHQLKVKKAFLLSVFIAAGLTSANLANIPLSWMGYATTSPKITFLMQQIFNAVSVFIGYTLFLTAIFSVAEGLTRMAFPDHLRLFELPRLANAASKQALGRVLGAYGWMGLFLFYACLFSLISSHYFGWWMPTDTEVDPNILASWRPALGPIFMALQAGTWEECLFRAVPLSVAVLLGNKFGHKTKIVVFTLFLQALIFGGGHANYPNLPGYSRVVELFIPAMAFGLVYLRFGLIVGVITHFTYDLVLMSLPIWSAHDTSLLIDKFLVVAFGLLPLGWILLARWKQGAWVELAEQGRNGLPERQVQHTAEAIDPPVAQSVAPWKMNKLLALMAVVAVIIVALDGLKKPPVDWPKLQPSRADALALAQAELNRQGIVLDSQWRATVMTSGGWYQPMDFVWREAGKEAFTRLVGTYLDTPGWTISWRRYEGPVEERAESWSVHLNADGTVHEVNHQLPEARAGVKLTREQATAKALTRIVALGWGDANALEEKSVEETVKPNRSDWRVTYIDKPVLDVKGGRAIIAISLAGDEVVSSLRTIHIPEEWNRAETEKNAKRAPFNMVNQFAIMLIVLMGLSSFVKRYSGRGFNVRVAVPWILIVVISSVATDILWFDASIAAFNTTSEFQTQVLLRLANIGFAAAMKGLLVFFVIQVLHAERPAPGSNWKNDFVLGCVLGVSISAVYSLIRLVVQSEYVGYPYFADLSSYFPAVTVILNGFKGFLGKLLMLILIIGLVRFATRAWKWWALIGAVTLTIVMSTLASSEPLIAGANQLVTVLSAFVIFNLIKRQQWGVAFVMSGVSIALSQRGVAEALYAQAKMQAAASSLLVMLATMLLLIYWYKRPIAAVVKSEV